jgi:hypothetical protein
MLFSPAEFGKFIADETEKWGKVVKFANVKPECARTGDVRRAATKRRSCNPLNVVRLQVGRSIHTHLPTVGDFVPGYEASAWQGVSAPKNTPAEIVNKLNREINAALSDPKIKVRLAELGITCHLRRGGCGDGT